MTTYPKRLIEVDLPIKRISAHARREKSIRHGHISTLHIWWARRPLAACRAVICASLWPDPADELCPQAFRDAVAQVLPAFAEQVRTDMTLAGLCKESWTRWKRLTEAAWRADHAGSWADMRYALLDFIADFANWDASTQPAFLETSRALTQAAHEALGGLPGTRPLVVDPFAGGGAIPLEALRVGADAFASDLNPVAVLLNKVVLEYIPKYGNAELRMRNAEGKEVVFQGLAEAVRYWGNWIKEEAEKELGRFYPPDPDGATPIAYLWARTVISEAPDDDGTGLPVEVPLMRSMWLAKKKGRNKALRWVRDSQGRVQTETVSVTYADGVTRTVRRPMLEIFEPKKASEVGDGTVNRGNATCPVTDYTTSVASVRRQLIPRRGGADDARLFAVATTKPNVQGRFYRLPTETDWQSVQAAAAELERRTSAHTGPLSLVPDETLPIMSGVFNAPIYGHTTWGSLFMHRQALALTTLIELVKVSCQSLDAAKDPEPGLAIRACLTLLIDKQADLGNALCAWEPVAQCPRHLFGRQAIGMVWDFAEGVATSNSSGSWINQVDRMEHILNAIGTDWLHGTVLSSSATSHPLPNDSVQVFATDPPYYNAVPYADLSDFFYVWIKRTLGDYFPGLFDSNLAPKADEICEMAGWDPVRYAHKTGSWFEENMRLAMSEGTRVLAPSGIGTVVFAHKSTSGWEALLQSMIDAGWIITGSWPIDTEMGSRLRAMNSATLASSIHLVCRPRENPDGSLRTDDVGDWRTVLQELPGRIHTWLPRLAQEGVVGADAIFACLGPALEIFSRYSRVEKASGETVALGEYLEQVWAAVSKEALALVFEGADATGFEEDARITAMWLWTLSTDLANDKSAGGGDEDEEADDDDDDTPSKSSGGGTYGMEYDAARKIAQGLGVNLEQLPHVVRIKGSTAQLLGVNERIKHLFGQDNIEESSKPKRVAQPALFEQLGEREAAAQGWELDDDVAHTVGETTLDRVHQSMLLFQAGRGEALRRFLVDDGVGKHERFWRLAQALSALYPASSNEKRWVDGVLARKRGLGL